MITLKIQLNRMEELEHRAENEPEEDIRSNTVSNKNQEGEMIITEKRSNR